MVDTSEANGDDGVLTVKRRDDSGLNRGGFRQQVADTGGFRGSGWLRYDGSGELRH